MPRGELDGASELRAPTVRARAARHAAQRGVTASGTAVAMDWKQYVSVAALVVSIISSA